MATTNRNDLGPAYMNFVIQKTLNFLSSLCEEWGGHLVEGPIPPAFRSPFSSKLGCDWESKVVFFNRDGKNEIFLLCGIVHEMAHTFATNQSPNDVDEWDFLGWEWALCRKLGMSRENWALGNAQYQIDDMKTGNFLEIQDLSTRELQKLLSERIRYARKSNIVKGFQPLLVRK